MFTLQDGQVCVMCLMRMVFDGDPLMKKSAKEEASSSSTPLPGSRLIGCDVFFFVCQPQGESGVKIDPASWK